MKRLRKKASIVWLLALLLGSFSSSVAAIRVALLDFSTDDNSYRSIEAAANFTSLVQIGLAEEPDIEWLERSQIRLAKAEFALAEMKAAGGLSPIRRGRMLGANWLITGHFSSDDRERPTLSFQVTELAHADVIASDTVLLPMDAPGGSRFGAKQVESATTSLRLLLNKARSNEGEATNQTRIAFLFFAETGEFPFGRGVVNLRHEMNGALERIANSNRLVRLVNFPKAYQATEESEMVVDGIIEASQDSWRQTADLYVWGRYWTTNSFTGGRRESKLIVELNLWDGSGQPSVVKEMLSAGMFGEVSASQANEVVKRLMVRILAAAHRVTSKADSILVRREIAVSIVDAYVSMSGHGQLSLHDRERFVEAVHMLETACFFDPDNARARLLWLTCRYGWWIDFGFDVKNQFWTKWRRNIAWKEYVERFGLQADRSRLPFPYDREDASSSYAGSLADVIKMFPQWHSAEEAALEDKLQKEGVHTSLMSAEHHGFPKEMPHDLAFHWRSELEAELKQRQQRISEFPKTNLAKSPFLGRREAVGQTNPPARHAPLPTGVSSSNSTSPAQMVSTPDWMKQHMSLDDMFRLYPPNVLPPEAKPEIEVIQFPSSYEVRTVKQMESHASQIWILAMDERSAPTSAAKPDLAGEQRAEACRLWVLRTEEARPMLFQAEGLPENINAMLYQSDCLWLGGDSIVSLNLTSHSIRKFALADGWILHQTEALGAVGDRIFAAGDSFQITMFDPVSGRWRPFPLPLGSWRSGTGNPYVLTGNDHWLGYVAGSAVFHDFKGGGWTNLPPLEDTGCFAPDGGQFWAGGRKGLQRFNTAAGQVESWGSPAFIESPMMGTIGNPVFNYGAQITRAKLEQAERFILDRLKKLESARKLTHEAKSRREELPDPFHLNARIPGNVAALANDGDFLWIGANNYFGNYLLLLHKPSLSLVSGHMMGVREHISSIAVSDKHVWLGTAHGDNLLFRMRKEDFLSMPRSRWVSLSITREERRRAVQSMSKPDQALYAFYSGDDFGVVKALTGLNIEKASVQDMLLLMWGNDASGVDDPDQFRIWSDRIRTRYPNTPWATYVNESIKPNDVAHAARQARTLALVRFDENHDGKLDAAETRAMNQDPEFAKLKANADEKELDLSIEKIIARYDRNGDSKLDLNETTMLCQTLTLYRQARELPGVKARTQLLSPLMDINFPSPSEFIRKADTNRDLCVDAPEFQKWIGDFQYGKH